MRIAICDDNVADRKHIERLLLRESDKRADTPNLLYVDSFGNKEQFLNSPLIYDMIIIDMPTTPTMVEEIIAQLMQRGSDAPIILYSSKIDYTTIPNLPDNVVHMKKPYMSDVIPELVKLGDAHVKDSIITIPITTADTVHHVPKNDILYCTPDGSDYITVLLDGTSLKLYGNVRDLQGLALSYKEFVKVSKKHVLNMRYLTKLTPLYAQMQDDRRFSINPYYYFKIKNAIDEMYEQE